MYDKLIDEMALEMAWEGHRFGDLARMATALANPDFLAKRVAARNVSDADWRTAEGAPGWDAALYGKLSDKNNWYMPLPDNYLIPTIVPVTPDEPFIPEMKLPDGSGYYSACTCPVCRKKFEERFGKPMPEIMDADVAAFRSETIVEFHSFITEYAAFAGMKSVICIMPWQLSGVSSGNQLLTFDTDSICRLPHVDNIGTDPYWYDDRHPYEYVYNAAKKCVEAADRHGKDHNIWIQTYGNKLGREEEIVTAYQAAYDAGARTIISWSYMGGEPNSYRSQSTEKTWCKTCEGVRRVRDMERDRMLAEFREKFRK